MSFCPHCLHDNPAVERERVVTDTWHEESFPDFYGRRVVYECTQDRLVTDCYCPKCDRYLEVPAASTAQGYLDDWISRRTEPLWIILLIGVGVLAFVNSQWWYLALLGVAGISYQVIPLAFGILGALTGWMAKLLFSNVVLAVVWGIVIYLAILSVAYLLDIPAHDQASIIAIDAVLIVLICCCNSFGVLRACAKDLRVAYRVASSRRKEGSKLANVK
jgi:hypothetical protein